MDATGVEPKDTVKDSETAACNYIENSGKKKRKKKKKKKASNDPEVSADRQDVDGDVESSNNHCFASQETAIELSTKPDRVLKVTLEEKPDEDEDGPRDKSQPSSCDSAPLDEASKLQGKRKKTKKKKKTGESTKEEKEEEISELHAVVSKSSHDEPSNENLARVSETSKDENETYSLTDSTTKKTKKIESTLEEKERETEVVEFEDTDRPDIESQTKVDTEMPGDNHAVPSEAKSSSGSPAGSRKKRKKKNEGGILLSELSLSEPGNDPEMKKIDRKNDGKELRDEKPRQPTRATADDTSLKKCTDERSLLEDEARERNNLFKVLTITCGLGLDTLRKLFIRIHPSWSNKPDDAKNVEIGKMVLKKHERTRFNTGDINDWDVSLITTVLLFSKKCAKEIKKMGFEDAVRTIKEQKNLLISHISSERMTDDEFNAAWDKISKSLETIGASPEDIEHIFTSGDTLETGKFYRDMFLQELASKEAVLQDINTKIDKMGEDVAEKVANRLSNQPAAPSENRSRLQDFGPKFDEWLRFCENVQHFDHQKNNYVLITDAMSPENREHFSVLRCVPWKMVLDFDPSSEEKGLYHDFVTKDGKNSLISMITPDEIRHQHASTINLTRNIDPRKTQWLFVRGREKDSVVNNGALTVHDWKSSSVKHISRFLSCCADPEKMDKHKPLICVVLPFRKETLPFLKTTLERLFENFDEFRLHIVGVQHKSMHDLQTQFGIHLADLTPGLLSLGLEDLLHVHTGKEYRMPTCQAKLPAKLTQHQYLFLQEYLDVMYDGCEFEDLKDLDDSEDEEKLNKVLSEHRESFLSGNLISFISLYDNHDARREVGVEVRNHIQCLINQRLNHSTIVEIRHSPGTGGTTIARRVLWDLHKSYPCAIVRLKDYKYDFDDDSHFINHLADRISAIQDICQTNPLILLDGNHSRIEALSNKLVRVLNSSGQRAVLLRCLHRTAKEDDTQPNSETSDVHERFYVNVRLEDSLTDLNQFEEKYKDYIDNFRKTSSTSPCRVFHFPLLAMLKGLPGFDSKLRQIIHESFDEMGGLQKEIAVVVAFIQHYATQETPASLLYKAFKKYVSEDENRKGITYKEINQFLTDQLLNLMVPAKPTRYPRRSSTSSVPESFTLQHPLVADMVLKRYFITQKSNIYALTREFLEFPIFQDDQFFSLVNDLFIRNRNPKSRFSILFEELRSIDARAAGKMFCELAEKTGDAIVFAHAARFHAKNLPYSFQDATYLMNQAFKCKNAQSRSRILYDMKGQILQSHLKFLVEKNKINSIQELEDIADKALKSYKNSRNWPPSYPHPLMGEVKVWISCIEWITKHECNGDTDRAFEFMTSKAPSFFSTCISDSFYLLDVVDSIVQKEENLADPEEIQKQANDLRMSLLRTFNKGRLPSTRRARSRDKEVSDNDIIRGCEALCSADKFPKCSPFELKRLQVHFILNVLSEQTELTKNQNIMKYLLKLLEDLVFANKQSARLGMASHLMRICLHITGTKCYSLEKGLNVAEICVQQSGYDPMPYFYQMMICFLGILDGNVLLYRDKYHKALDNCREKSQNHCRRLLSTHYLKKEGEGMNRLITKSALLTGETEYHKNIDNFWTTHSRKKLLECRGRIRIRSKPGKRKQVYIELVQGNIELYVTKNADIGKVERDYNPGTMVYFVVSFTLEGPVANGITFQATSSSSK